MVCRKTLTVLTKIEAYLRLSDLVAPTVVTKWRSSAAVAVIQFGVVL